MTTTEATAAPAATDGWHLLARSGDVTSRPRRVHAGGRGWTAYRPFEGAPAAVVSDLCPHRLVRLDHGAVVDGRLECPYHGWQFASDGTCLVVPSSGPGTALPPRAHLATPLEVREQDGSVWVLLDERPAPAPPEVVLGNDSPALRSAWHPVALLDELGKSPVVVRLLGQDYSVGRTGDGWSVHPQPAAVEDRFGVLWVAPEPPAVPLLEAPDDADPRFGGRWLIPSRTSSPAGTLADNFVDVAHFPFVYAATFGAADEHEVDPFDVEPVPGGFRSVQEQWFDNPQDPGVAAGLRPLRQRRRSTYEFRLPFQLTLRMEELDAGSVKTILFFLQPEDRDSTRIYTKMLMHGVGGVDLPSDRLLADEVAFEQAVLDEDLALQDAMTGGGLPLRLRDELHVRADRSGVALRRALADLSGGAP